MEIESWAEVKIRPILKDRFPHPATKVLEEARELMDAPDDPAEAADVLIAILVFAYFNEIDLLGAAQSKMAVLWDRDWGRPDEEGTIRHL